MYEGKKKLTGNKNGIPRFPCFGNIAPKASIDLVRRPGQKDPQEGDEGCESHGLVQFSSDQVALLPGLTEQHTQRGRESSGGFEREKEREKEGLLIASIKQVRRGGGGEKK